MSVECPPVGTFVHFYRYGSRDDKPLPGLIVESFSNNGVLRLLVFHTNGDLDVRPSVHHYTSESLYDERGNLTDNARRNGFWDYHPWHVPEAPKAIFGEETEIGEEIADSASKNTKKTPELTWDEKERRVVEIINDGDFDYIYRRAKFWGVTKADLQSLMMKHGKMADSLVGVNS